MDYYIYYRVQARNTPALHRQVAGMQQFLADTLPVAATLRRRPEEVDGLQTWMEVYTGIVPQPEFENHLSSAVAQFGLLPLTEGQRHLECFMEFAPCA